MRRLPRRTAWSIGPSAFNSGNPWRWSSRGPAAVVFASGRLTVAIPDDLGWDFHVAPLAAVAGEAGSTREFPVAGLSHHWGGKARGTHTGVAGRLLGEACTLLVEDPSCETCEAGGPGATGCGVECDDGSGCSAQCGSGLFACCTCPDGCRCCPSQPQLDRATR
jgi:hypothetical protein